MAGTETARGASHYRNHEYRRAARQL